MTTLAELRQASLKEQKQKEQKPLASDAAPLIPAPASAEPPAAQSAPTPSAPAKPNSAPHLTVVDESHPPAPSAEQQRDADFFARLHETLSHKTLHQSGAKVSADMSPLLFHRAKRYCLDHGNITLRQVLVELLTAYLEEEGY
jgi:hypothetical protein